ncbi:MAG: Cna B-type domain-containing protein [Clostridiales bacterium]|nr:Cna B-type domain-containing protein [Clostridiales bacterium]
MKKTASLVSIVLFLAMLLSVCGVHSEAMGSLTIKYISKDTGRGVSGVEMSLFRVGDISGGGYALTPNFNEAAVDLNSLTTDNSKHNAANTLYTYAVHHSVSGTVLYTDSNGNAYFSGLLPGVFLVAQTKAVSGFKTISPYIVFIPEQGVGGASIYNVLSNVKTEKESNGGGGGDSSFSVTVAKIWDDSDDADGIRPESVSVTLLRNGNKLTTVSLSRENGWKHTFLKLSGNKSSYSVEETPVDGYTASYSGSASEGFVIINSHSAVNPPKTDNMSVFVRKQWVDDNDRQGIRPKSVTVQLIKDAEVYRTAQLDGANDWSFRFDELDDGEYTVKEISPEGYSTSYNRTGGNLYTVINTVGDEKDNPPLKPINPTPSDQTDISIEKVWLDNENKSGARPESITVRLIKDGGIYRELELTEETDWRGVFSDVPSDASYSITEKEVQDYSAAYSKSDDNGFIITNTFTPGNTSIGMPPKPFVPALTDENTSSADETSEPIAIPQTGNLNWPVPVLAVSGIIFLIIGFVLLPSKRSDTK